MGRPACSPFLGMNSKVETLKVARELYVKNNFIYVFFFFYDFNMSKFMICFFFFFDFFFMKKI